MSNSLWAAAKLGIRDEPFISNRLLDMKGSALMFNVDAAHKLLAIDRSF